jgi:peptide chain release factor 1
VPPSEKRGRVHTSTITVAILPEPEAGGVKVGRGEIEVETCRGTGPGGQKRNKTESAVVITHRPSGVAVRCDAGRSQHRNREAALALLEARLSAAERARRDAARAEDRRLQLGSGERGDKRRTIRERDNMVVDHPTGRRWTYRDYLRGEW